MIVNRWKELGPELLKDFWTDSQVCHIFSGLVEITKDGRYDCIEIEQEGLTDTKKEKRDQLKEIWDVADHKPKEREHYYQSITKFWKTAWVYYRVIWRRGWWCAWCICAFYKFIPIISSSILFHRHIYVCSSVLEVCSHRYSFRRI